MNTVGERENKKSPVFAVHDEELRTHVSGGQQQGVVVTLIGLIQAKVNALEQSELTPEQSTK